MQRETQVENILRKQCKMAVIKPFKASIPDLSDIISYDEFFGAAKRKFPLYLSDGIYEDEDKEAIYIYRIKTSNRSHTGILANTSVLDYIKGRIKKHENTIAAKEIKMINLLKERGAMIKPILLTYENVLDIDAMINRVTASNQPFFSINFMDEEHLFWKIDDEYRLNVLKKVFDKKVAKSYICDGHHRAKTAELLYKESLDNGLIDDNPYESVLVAFFPASEIEIHNYNRAIVNLKGMPPEKFIKEIEAFYTVKLSKRPVNPIMKHQLGMFIRDHWYKLSLRKQYIPDEHCKTSHSLDVHILNEKVLSGILNIKDIRTEPDIKYVEGPKGAFSLERRIKEGRAEVAFNLYPVALEDLMKISDERDTLPPKSTWIEPRMRNGFIVELFQNE